MASITSTTVRPRRGHRSHPLVERDHELAVLQRLVHDARAGKGGVVVLDGPPGGGKSALLRSVRELARDARMRIVTAAGGELEREFQFGLAIQLFDPPSRAPDDRVECFEREVRLGAALLEGTTGRGSTDPDARGYSDARDYSVIHGLFRATQNLAAACSQDGQPLGLAILIDDAHWADRLSLRFLAYLAQRTAELPIAIALTATPGSPSADDQALGALRRAAGKNLLPVAPLGADAVARVVRGCFPDADAELCAACGHASGGNPFLLTELLAAIADGEQAPTGAQASAIAEIVPDAVRDQVVARLESVPPTARAVAEAVAVLGEETSVHRVARLVEADVEAVVTAADQLAAIQLLAPGTSLSLAQPMLGTAIRASLAPFARAKAHLRAARVLAEQGAGAALVAGHLMRAPADDDSAAAAELALARGRALCARGDFRAAAVALRAGAAQVDGESELAGELTAGYVAAAALVPELRTDALEARDRLIADRGERLRPHSRAAVAHTVFLDGLHGVPRHRVGDLADLAWGDGALLQSRDDAPFSVPLLAAGLLITDDLERALETCEAALHAVGDEDPPSARDLLSYVRARALYEQGRITEAQAAADPALHHTASRGDDGCWQSTLAVIARCHIEGGRLDQAEAALAPVERNGSRDNVGRVLALGARAQLRLAQHRPQDALQDAMDAGALLAEQLPDASPGAIAWRSTAALAQLTLGEPAKACELVEEELERARRMGVTRIVVRDLRILGLAMGRERDGIEQLAQAVAIGGSYPNRLEYVRALIDYGAALRRANRRADARKPLRLGLDLSHRGGACVLESRARAELVAAGGRPRRSALSGVDSLTASQRRVAELAANGLTTRQVAAALFVTPKTVEFHLRHVYSKLGVSSRAELTKSIRGL